MPAENTISSPISSTKLTEEQAQEFQHLMSQYIWNPMKFACDQLGAEYQVWQDEAWDTLLDKQFLAVRSGNGPGKTCFLALSIIWFLMTKRMAKIPCTAVSLQQLETQLWSELYMWISSSELAKTFLFWSSKYVRVRGYEGAWYAVARTAMNSKGAVNEALQGFHAPYLLYVVDEASGVPDKAIDSLESAATNVGAYGVLCSNPTRTSGVFFNAFHKDRDLWANYHVTMEKAARVTDKFRERMKKKYGGEDTNGFKIRVLGEWPSEEYMGLVTRAEYEAVQVRYPKEYSFSSSCWLSIDPAGSEPEADATTFGIRAGNIIVDIQTCHTLSIPEIATRAIELIEKYDPLAVYIDTIGIGAGLADVLDSLLETRGSKIRVTRVHAGSSALDNSQFFNKRAELYWRGSEAIRRGTIEIAADLPWLEEDLVDLRKEYTMNTQKLKIESKPIFRTRNEGRSSDFGDAFAMLFYNMDEIEEGISQEQHQSAAAAAIIANEMLQKRNSWRNVDQTITSTQIGRISMDAISPWGGI